MTKYYCNGEKIGFFEDGFFIFFHPQYGDWDRCLEESVSVKEIMWEEIPSDIQEELERKEI